MAKSSTTTRPEKILVTGSAGFIGSHLVRRLLTMGHTVVSLDNLNSYYDVRLKEARLDWINQLEKPHDFRKLDLVNFEALQKLFREISPDRVVHLAGQPGVRYSIDQPRAYIDSNIIGFFNILECCRNHPVKHLVYASSSSVYGLNDKIPFEESDITDAPASLYAATKKSNELMGFCYNHLYNIPMTGLRFFTVYGPWGRPDMAVFKFTKAIVEGSPISLYHGGKHRRDFTYIDDIIESLARLTFKNPSTHEVYNIGNQNPEYVTNLISALETALEKKAITVSQPIQPGDVLDTFAKTSKLDTWVDFKPNTPIEKGIHEFVVWYKKFSSQSDLSTHQVKGELSP